MNANTALAPLSMTVSTGDWLQFVASFALVLGLLFALLWWLKRIQNSRGFGRKDAHIEVIDSMGVGPRQKLMLVRVRDREVLIGIGPNHMQALTGWVDGDGSEKPPGLTPGSPSKQAMSPSVQSAPPFAQTMAQLKDTQA